MGRILMVCSVDVSCFNNILHLGYLSAEVKCSIRDVSSFLKAKLS